MNPLTVYYILLYLRAVGAAVLMLALLVLVVRWLLRRFGPTDVPNDDGETM